MGCYTLLLLASVMVTTAAWSAPYHPARPMRLARYAPIPHRIPIPPLSIGHLNWNRHKRGQQHDHEDDHGYDHDHDFDRDHGYHRDKETSGVTGPVHTFVKTDKNANYKWGVRHHVGNKYAS